MAGWLDKFEDGGKKKKFLEPNDKKLPQGRLQPFYYEPSSELASSIGGENGKPAYLIPTFKYGEPLSNPSLEYQNTGEHLGGPFKTWQEADEWENTIRHPYVEKGQSLPSPLKRWGKDYENGGFLGTTNKPNKYNSAWGGAFQNGGTTLPSVTISGISPRQQAYNDSLDLFKRGESFRKIDEQVYRTPSGGWQYSDQQYNELTRLQDDAERLGNIPTEVGIRLTNTSGPRFKKPVYNPSENTINHITPIQPNISYSSQENQRQIKPIPNGWEQPDANYPTLKIRYSQQGKPTHIVNSTGETLPYVSDTNPYSAVTKKFAYPEKKKNGGWLDNFQNGGEMSYYQNGLDFKPRTISKNGSNIPQAQKGKNIKITDPDGKERMIDIAEYTQLYNSGTLATKNNQSDVYSVPPLPEVEIIGQKSAGRRWLDNYAQTISNESDGLISGMMAPMNALASFPQLAAVSAFTGKPERPSTAMGIENPVGAIATDMILDPINLIGAEFMKNPFKSFNWNNIKGLAKDVFNKNFSTEGYDKIHNLESGNKNRYKDIIDLTNKNWKITDDVERIVSHNNADELNKTWRHLSKQTNTNQEREIIKKVARKEGENIVVSEAPKLSEVTNTGIKPVIHFRTNSLVDASVALPEKKSIYSLAEGKVNKEVVDVSNVNVSPEYKSTVADNIQYIEETVPGAKVFGSARGVAEGDLPHLTHDYDALISRKNYDKHVAPKFEFTQDLGPAKQHSIGKDFGDQGLVDFNIIEKTKSGKATGERANQLFKQFHPDEYFDASRKAFKKSTDIEIPYTPDELLESSNLTTKTIVDAYESVKPKHINKIDSYISYGNPDRVIEAQDTYIKSLVGKKGTIGHQFSPEELSDIERNKKILEEIDFLGDINSAANNPKRMQAAINDFYINNTTLSRGSYAGLNEKDLDLAASAFKEWKPELGGGQAMGSGMNHVLMGDSGYEGFYASKQLGITHNTTDPISYIDDIKRQIHGNYPYSETEKEAINNILKENGIPQKVETPVNLINFTAEHTNAKKILSDVADITGRKAVTSSEYGNSPYASTYKDFDEKIDALQYALRKDNPAPKSYLTRKKNLEITGKVKLDDITKQKFQKISNLLEGGLTKAEERQKVLQNRLDKIRERNVEQTRISTSRIKTYQENKYEIDKLNAEILQNEEHIDQIIDRMFKVKTLKERTKNIAIATGVISPVAGIAVAAALSPPRSRSYESVKKAREKQTSSLDEKYNNRHSIQKEHGGIVKDNLGYYNPKNIGHPVEIDSNNITMEGINFPIVGISDTGDTKLLKPGKDYKFRGKKVTEYPIARYGINELHQLEDFSNTPSKKWLQKYS